MPQMKSQIYIILKKVKRYTSRQLFVFILLSVIGIYQNHLNRYKAFEYLNHFNV